MCSGQIFDSHQDRDLCPAVSEASQAIIVQHASRPSTGGRRKPRVMSRAHNRPELPTRICCTRRKIESVLQNFLESMKSYNNFKFQLQERRYSSSDLLFVYGWAFCVVVKSESYFPLTGWTSSFFKTLLLGSQVE